MLCGFRRLPARHEENGVEAILHIKIAFALGAVAQNLQAIRMLQQLPIKIEDMSVSIALAENGDEAKDVALKAEAFAISLDEALAGNFRSAIQRRLNGKRCVFGRRNFDCLAVNRAGGGKGEALDVIGPHRLQDVECGDGVLLEVPSRMLGAKTHIGIGGKMENEVATRHGCGECGQVQGITLDELEARMKQRGLEKFFLAGGKIVPSDDRDAVGEKPVDKIGTNETCGSGDEGFLHER